MKYLTLVLALSSCAAVPLSPAGSQVKVANAITVTEVAAYRDLGPLACTTDAFTDCDIDLRNRAGALGATVIVIESRTPSKCYPSGNDGCTTVYARAYRGG